MSPANVFQLGRIAYPPHGHSSCASSYTPTVALLLKIPCATKAATKVRSAGRSSKQRLLATVANDESSTSSASADSRADDVLPDSFTQALAHAAEATREAINAGRQKCLVEILLSGLWDPSSGNLFAEEGDQQRFWKITRRFVEQMSSACEANHVKALYPDVGVAAMLKNEWKDATFKIGAVSDKAAAGEDDDLVIIAAVDPQGLNAAKRVVAEASQRGPVILFNPRLASGDVGIGLNVRRMRVEFLSLFTVTYSLRPLGEFGTIFRRYPGQWQVFIEDESTPGRYSLVAEMKDRPTGDDLDEIVSKAAAEANGDAGSVVRDTRNVLGGFAKFLGALSR